jgi:hypothetical protein
MDLDTRIRRFEQQLAAFEKLHTHELKDFQDKLAAYMRIHADEVKLLHRELDELKQWVAKQASPPGKSAEQKEAP